MLGRWGGYGNFAVLGGTHKHEEVGMVCLLFDWRIFLLCVIPCDFFEGGK